MFSHQIFSRFSHFPDIQRHISKMGIKPLGWNRELPVQDLIFISLLTFPVSGMKIQRHFLGFLDPDIFRQPLVQSKRKLFSRHTHIRIENRHISQSMNSCIRSAGTHDRRLLSRKIFQAVFQDLLDGDPIWLYLPAAIIGPVIGYRQSDSLHSPNTPFPFLTGSVPVITVPGSQYLPPGIQKRSRKPHNLFSDRSAASSESCGLLRDNIWLP